MQDLKLKLNNELRNVLINYSQDFKIFNEMKIFLTMTNNARRRIKIKNDVNSIQKKDKIANKSRHDLVYTRIITIIAKFAISTSQIISSLLVNIKNFKKSNCFICHKHNHIARDYSNKKTRAIMIKELQVNNDSKYDFDSKN